MDITTNEGLSALARQAIDHRKGIDELENMLKHRRSRYEEISQKIVSIFEKMTVDSMRIEGMTFYVQEKTSVKTPKTLEEKAAFFEYLKSKGVYDEMISVNSMTLNAFFKDMSEEAQKAGILDFRMPGIEEPTTYKQLRIRAS